MDDLENTEPRSEGDQDPAPDEESNAAPVEKEDGEKGLGSETGGIGGGERPEPEESDAPSTAEPTDCP